MRYREGHEEEESAGEKAGENGMLPITAFLIVMTPEGKTEVVTDIPGFPLRRRADLTDIRDMSAAVSLEAQARSNANHVSSVFSSSLKAMPAFRKPSE